MIIGTGIDITELNRIKEILESKPKFVERILTKQEQVQLEVLKGKRKIEFLAGRFAAKEAYSKAKGTGIGKSLSFLDIEITNDERGKPHIHSIACPDEKVHLSISHSEEYAIANVIIEE